MEQLPTELPDPLIVIQTKQTAIQTDRDPDQAVSMDRYTAYESPGTAKWCI